jgi:hypothetical protein
MASDGSQNLISMGTLQYTTRMKKSLGQALKFYHEKLKTIDKRFDSSTKDIIEIERKT